MRGWFKNQIDQIGSNVHFFFNLMCPFFYFFNNKYKFSWDEIKYFHIFSLFFCAIEHKLSRIFWREKQKIDEKNIFTTGQFSSLLFTFLSNSHLKKFNYSNDSFELFFHTFFLPFYFVVIIIIIMWGGL